MADPPPEGRPVLIVWLFVGIVILLLGLTVHTSQLLASGRAFVAAQGQWARAQRDAVLSLTRYAADRDPANLEAFQRAMAVIEGDRRARIELTRPRPDAGVVREGLLAGGVHATEVEGLETLYARLADFGPIAYLLKLWERSDPLVDELTRIAERLREGDPTLSTADAVRRVHRVARSLQPLEEEFAQTLGDIQRTAESVMLIGILIIACVLLIGGIMLSRRFLQQDARLRRTLAQGEARLREDMRRRALHDPLTGLPNRAMFMESLERAVARARRRASRFSVLFIDLDRFKEVNDSLGHQAGDDLLKAVAERLGTAVRQSDLVARLGGDEFVVLIEEHGGPEEVMIVAQKVNAALARPVAIEAREAQVSASIGIASFPEDGADLQTLVRNADVAMYQAKERGRDNFQFYSPELNRLSHERFEQAQRIRGALDRGEVFLEYLPEVDLATGRIHAIEALLRWRDPARGVVPPEHFLPVAGESGTLHAIGRWMLGHALPRLAGWRAAGLDVRLALNLSSRQLQEPDLAADVQAALGHAGVRGEWLRIEVTEPALMEDSEAAHRTLRALTALGVELAIDDFGTGHSSLGLLRGMPVRVVKIDRALVSACPTQRECAAIVQATAAMACALGIRVVAEGVETEEQRATMASLGCEGAQGFLYYRPLDAEALTAAITRAVAEQTFTA